MTCRKFWLGMIGTCRSWVTFILIENRAVLLEEESMQCCNFTTMFCKRGGLKHFKKKSEEPQLIQK
jgi:hypothetical protein